MERKDRQVSELEGRSTQLAQKLEATHSELTQKVFEAQKDAEKVGEPAWPLLSWPLFLLVDREMRQHASRELALILAYADPGGKSTSGSETHCTNLDEKWFNLE